MCVLILVCLGSSILGLCLFIQVYGRRLIFLVLCRSSDFFHEGTDALADFTDLDADIPQKGAACPSSHDHDGYRVHFGQIEFHGEP